VVGDGKVLKHCYLMTTIMDVFERTSMLLNIMNIINFMADCINRYQSSVLLIELVYSIISGMRSCSSSFQPGKFRRLNSLIEL